MNIYELKISYQSYANTCSELPIDTMGVVLGSLLLTLNTFSVAILVSLQSLSVLFGFGNRLSLAIAQLTFTCSDLAIETLVQS